MKIFIQQLLIHLAVLPTHNARLRTIDFFLFLASCLLLFSCYTPRYVYSPAAHNVPLLLQKGDSKLAINYSSNLNNKKTSGSQVFRNRSNGMDAQGAVAISNKFALQANYFLRNEKNEGNYSTYRDSAVLNYKRKLTEIGLGYYTKLQPHGSVILQVFAGVGFGRFSFTDFGKDNNQLAYARFHQAAITKFYVQPAIMYQYKKRVAASFSSRLSIIRFHNIKTDYSSAELRNFELDSLSLSPVVFWEPAFINTIGFKKIPGLRVEYQVGLSVLLSHRFIDARSFNFSLGLQADLPKLFKMHASATKKN